jgi:hypothetical protein
MTPDHWCDLITGSGVLWCTALCGIGIYAMFNKTFRGIWVILGPSITLLTFILIWLANELERRILGLI